MSETKRAPLISLGPQKAPKEPPRKTVRIAVALPESTEDTCPEYSYKEELAKAKRVGKHKEPGAALNGANRLEDFGEDDDDVKRIAREMEQKYGTGTSMSKKKRKGRKDDYADIGMGYDESDSFIDNTDGYDEMIPQNVTTLHGGFYINSGALEFKTDDEADSDFSSDSSGEEGPQKTVSRKRVIESSDETDRENKTETGEEHHNVEKKRKLQNGGNGVAASLKKKLLGQGQNKIYLKKRRLLDPQKKTVKELLREKREDLNMSIPDELQKEANPEEKQSEKKTMSIASVTDTIESVVKAATEKTPVKVSSTSDPEPIQDVVPPPPTPEVKLPENLSPDIVSVLGAIRKAAGSCSFEGKTSFSSEINLLILRLERKSKCLGKPSKMKVYEHLAPFLHCKSDLLIKRAKVLVLDDEQKKLKNLLSELKLEIEKIMPGLLESYEKESHRILQKKFSQESADNEENKSLRMPKRRFQWNDVTKKHLKDILMMRKRCLLLEGKSKDVLDNQMATFLKTEVQILWPEGWMSMNALTKIYNMYADPKRILHNSTPTTKPPPPPPPPSSSSITPNVTMKNLTQTFNTSNLSITPIAATTKPETIITKVQNEPIESINLSMKSLPEPSEEKPVVPPEPKLKVKPPSELLMPSVANQLTKESALSLAGDENVIILDGPVKQDRFSPKEKFQTTSEDSYCQVIDLSDKNDFKLKSEPKVKREKTVSPIAPEQMSHVAKHHELSITPTFPKTTSAGDDIQMVMENLKVLQKMSSSPKKSLENSPTSSAVSVIAVNKSFAPKPSHSESSSMQRYDYHKSEYSNSSFQDEFQKQLLSAMGQYPASSNKNYNSIDRYPHIASSGSSMVSGDKYYQNSNNNYAQSANGHKSSTSAPQTVTAPKSQQK